MSSPRGPAVERPKLPPGTLYSVFGPFAAIVLMFGTLAITPPGGPIGGTWTVPCLLGAAVLAAFSVFWLRRLPRPIRALQWCAAAPSLLWFATLAAVSLLLLLRRG
jgi:hypothetical protein